ARQVSSKARFSRLNKLRSASSSSKGDKTNSLLATKELLSSAGISAKRLDRVMEHVALGMPTNASKSSPENFLLARNQYVLSYSKTRKTPNWVSWTMRFSDLSGTSRHDSFRADVTIPKGWGRATDLDYAGSGYTRGHIVASSERLSDKRSNSKTFVLTNVLPQLQANNGGPWLHMENFYRDQVSQHNMDVYIIAGGLYEGPKKTIGANKIAVPSATWKVAVLVERGKGLEGVSATSRVVSIIVPNELGKVSIKQPFTDFRVSPREIQRRAGVELFAGLPKAIRTKLLDHVDTEVVPDKFKQLKAKKP
ncbi:MAG: DNA/RNA non-specific endonuclease, partial [Kofleriaceae bacterium]|nr:DNA/RNA non-specific endonuclease [Kofleriaceae bacterium]